MTSFTARHVDPYETDAITFDPEIWERISEDGTPPSEDVKIEHGNDVYIGGFVDGILACAFIVCGGNRLHFMVLKPYRPFARLLFEACYQAHGKPVECRIPAFYVGVINFAAKNGFKHAGVEPQSFRKGGVAHDRIIMRREA